MPDVNHYTFDYREVAEALVKQAGLHEGKWQITMSFGMAATNMGNGTDLAKVKFVPGAAMAVTGIGLVRAGPESPASLTVDASAVNPATALSLIHRKP